MPLAGALGEGKLCAKTSSLIDSPSVRQTRSYHLTASILHVTTVHRPLDSRIYYKEARALAAEGWNVSLATTVEKAQTSEGVKLLPLGSRSGSRLRRIPRNLRALFIMLAKRDIVHIHDPELLLTACLPVLIGRRVIFDAHEPAYHDDFVGQAHYLPRAVRPAVRALYKFVQSAVLPRLAGVVVTTESMVPQFARYVGEDRVALVRNFPNISPEERRAAQSAGSPLGEPYILHTGGASKLRAFHVMVAAAEGLRARSIRAPIVNIGQTDLSAYTPAEREALLQRAADADVRLLGVVPYADALRWTAHARAGYTPLIYARNNAEGIPNKLFEYFAFGVPVVACSFGRVAEFIEREHAGVLVDADDVSTHVEALRRLVSDDAFRAPLAEASAKAGARYSFDGELARLQALYRKTLENGR